MVVSLLNNQIKWIRSENVRTLCSLLKIYRKYSISLPYKRIFPSISVCLLSINLNFDKKSRVFSAFLIRRFTLCTRFPCQYLKSLPEFNWDFPRSYALGIILLSPILHSVSVCLPMPTSIALPDDCQVNVSLRHLIFSFPTYTTHQTSTIIHSLADVIFKLTLVVLQNVYVHTNLVHTSTIVIHKQFNVIFLVRLMSFFIRYLYWCI